MERQALLRRPIRLTSRSLNFDPSLNEGSHTHRALWEVCPCESSRYKRGIAQMRGTHGVCSVQSARWAVRADVTVLKPFDELQSASHLVWSALFLRHMLLSPDCLYLSIRCYGDFNSQTPDGFFVYRIFQAIVAPEYKSYSRPAQITMFLA